MLAGINMNLFTHFSIPNDRRGVKEVKRESKHRPFKNSSHFTLKIKCTLDNSTG